MGGAHSFGTNAIRTRSLYQVVVLVRGGAVSRNSKQAGVLLPQYQVPGIYSREGIMVRMPVAERFAFCILVPHSVCS